MRNRSSISLACLAACLCSGAARAHELWFQPVGGDGPMARLTFGDSPAPAEAERVAEIAHAEVWGDGLPLEVRRLPDGLEALIPERRPSIMSAFADRGVVDYEGDSFVIQLAAYAQTRPVVHPSDPELGLDDDQVRLLLVSSGDDRPVVRATWRGEPAADVAVQVFRDPDEAPMEARTDDRGELACPDLTAGPVSLLAVVFDRTPGELGGRDYSHTRFKATLTIEPPEVTEASEASRGD